MDISVIVPTHNRASCLEQAVRSAFALDYPASRYEIVVVDNVSTDATPQLVQGLQKESKECNLRYVREDRLGLHHARHAGARAAKGEILVFTDDDATFDPGWLKAYADAFEAHPEMAAAGGPVRPAWEVSPPQWLLEFIGDSKIFGMLSLMEPYQEFHVDQKGFFFGVNMAIRRDVLFEVRGFNPEAFGDLWLGDGETGLNKKLWQRGMLVGYAPKAIVYHHIPRQRMTVEYLCRRMANQGACDMYARFHGEVRSFPVLKNVASLIVSSSRLWITAAVLKGRTDARSLRIQLHAARTQSRLKYVLQLMFDKNFRDLVQRENWLNEPSSSDRAVHPACAETRQNNNEFAQVP